jgi:hypothetical protein
MTSQQLRDYEVDFLSAEIDELDCEIYSLQEKRAKLRAHVNQLRAPTSFLPPETLSLIFQHACALPSTIDIDDPHFPIVLGGVSTHWRQGAWSTSSLWTAIAINVGHALYVSATTLSLLRLYFGNMKKRSLSLRIHVTEEAGDRDENETQQLEPGKVPIEELWNMLFQNRERIKGFFCDYFWRRWWSIVVKHFSTSLASDAMTFPNLEYLRLWTPEDDDNSGSSESMTNVEPLDSTLPSQFAPRLHHASIVTHMPPIPLPLGQLTILILENIPVDRCVGLLKQCPKLTDYHCRKPQEPSDTEPLPETPLVLERMKCFGWTFGYSQWDYVLLTLVQMPVLLRFRIEAKHDLLDNDIHIRTNMLIEAHEKFWPKLTTLEVFERTSNHTPHTDVEVLLKYLPSSVEELHLWDVTDDEGDYTCSLLTFDKPDQENVFPRLNMLTMIGEYVDNLHMRLCTDSYDWSSSLLPDMLRSRREGPAEKWEKLVRLDCLFLGCRRRKLEYEEKRNHNFSELQQAELQKFVDRGMKLITTDSEGTAVVWKEPKCGAL